jgi:C-methyltransferase C-terminal domain/Putative zinc binding domain/Methyltransferase domain
MADSPCRFCHAPLRHTFVDLGMSPLCESYLNANQLNQMERFYPLHVLVCESCLLVQLDEYVSQQEIFSEYAYFSSYSDSWVQHARNYSETMIQRFQLNNQSRVIEIASNDGYLLQHFVAKGIPCLGIEPAANVAKVAKNKSVPTIVEFFGEVTARKLAADGQLADLLVANNVLAQVPNLNDFVTGLKVLLGKHGVLTIEFPHLMRLIEGNQFDTIYHEHFSYFSFYTASNVLAAHGLRVFDVEELPTHGGSLRLYCCHADDDRMALSSRVIQLQDWEESSGIACLDYYRDFGRRVKETKRRILRFLIDAKEAGKTIAGYGAPGKGNTLLNYCGIRTDFLDYTVDRNRYKHGKFLPGTRIPIFSPKKISQTRPDFLFILPWNFKDEIMEQCHYIREWGGKFVVPIPMPIVYH